MKKAISILLVISFVLMGTVMSASAANFQSQTTTTSVNTVQGNNIDHSQNGATAIAGSIGFSPLGLNAAGVSQSQSNSNVVVVANRNSQSIRTRGFINH